MSASALKQRLRADLKAAMQARAADEVRLLRTLIAALDNAEAVAGSPERYVPRAFGDPSGEVARLALDSEAVAAVLEAEIAARLAAAADYTAHGRDEEAARLRDESATIGRYLA
jgi:uncharacterized protein YqeY